MLEAPAAAAAAGVHGDLAGEDVERAPDETRDVVGMAACSVPVDERRR